MRLTFTTLLAATGVAFACGSAFAAEPAGYYNSLNGKKDIELKKAVKAIVVNHTAISYSSGTWTAFHDTDVRYVNGTLCWWDMYSSNNVPVSSGHPGMNVEHSVANSWWGGTKNDAYKDLVHLNPSNSDANSRKSNYPLGEIATRTWDNGVTFIGKPATGTCGGAQYVYEPAAEYKGDFARVFMYMFTVYDDISWKTSNTNWMYNTASDLLLKPWAYEMLLKWSANDPVSQKERDRNDGIYKHQKNRNPFIDHPELAEYIWGSKRGQTFYLDGNGGGDDDDPIVPPIEDPEEKVLVNENFENGTLGNFTNIVVSGNNKGWYDKSYQGNHYATASTYSSTAAGGPFEFWLISPEFEMNDDYEYTLTFRTQGAYYYAESKVEAYALPSAADCRTLGNCDKLNAVFCTPNPNGGSPVYSDWKESGAVKIPVQGAKGCVGFRFTNPTGGNNLSSTYCLDDVKVVATKKQGTAIEEIEESDDDSFLVEVWGNTILAPEGARIFNLNGVEVNGENLQRGVYIVVKSTFAAPVKVLVK